MVHGDVEGAENVRRSLSDWLRFMKLQPAGPDAEIDRYIGYWEPYATSHDPLDKDTDIQAEVRAGFAYAVKLDPADVAARRPATSVWVATLDFEPDPAFWCDLHAALPQPLRERLLAPRGPGA